MSKLNANDVLERFRSKTLLSKKLHQYLVAKNGPSYHEFMIECARLSLDLQKLGIKVRPSQPFEEDVSVDILKQYERLLCRLGDTGQQDELVRLQQDQTEIIDPLRLTLKQLRRKKKQLDLKPEELRTKQERIKKMNWQKKVLERQIKRASQQSGNNSGGGGGGNVPSLADQSISLEGEFLQREMAKNHRLRDEMNELRQELHGFIDAAELEIADKNSGDEEATAADNDDDDDDDECIDRLLAKLERRYQSFYRCVQNN